MAGDARGAGNGELGTGSKEQSGGEPEAASGPSAIYRHRLVVAAAEIDGLEHASNIAYVQWMQDAALAHSSALGWPPERYEQAGVGWVARSHFIEYLQPAYLGDEITVRTWVDGFQRVSSVRKYELVRTADAVVVARAETNWAFVRRSDGRLLRIPPEVASAFTAVSASAAQ